MAAHIGQPAPSRRFIKVYLLTWGLLAVGALGYLAMLAFPRQALSPPQAVSPAQTVSPPKVRVTLPPGSGTGESKVVAEVRGSLSEIRKDVAEPKSDVGERVENEKVVKPRLPAPEDRVSTIDAVPPPSSRGHGGKAADAGKAADGGKPIYDGTTVDGDKAADDDKTAGGGKAPNEGKAVDVSTVAPKDGEPPAKDDAQGDVKQAFLPPPAVAPPVVPIETGSIPPKDDAKAKAKDLKEEIVFGEPVVTRGGREFAVQLAAAATLSALKQSWGQLAERHAGALAHLRPRVVAPRGGSGSYRLLAGPLATKADAERICSELRIGPKGCFATPYAGTPL